MSLYENISSINGYDAFLLILFVILLLGIFHYIFKIKELGLKKLQLREGYLSKRKMDMQLEKIRLESLKDAALVLNDNEKKELDALEIDKSILARKDIFLQNNIEKRLKRLEITKDIVQGSETLREIKEMEEKLMLENDDESHSKKKQGFFGFGKKKTRKKKK